MKISRNVIVVTVALITLITSFLFAYNRGICHESSSYIINVDPSSFIKILIQNLGFFLLILLGALFYNISNFFLLLFNGNLWGLAAKFATCSLGFYNAIILVSPHIFIEILWIGLSVTLSFKLSTILYQLFNDKIDAHSFITEIKKMKYQFLFAFLLVIVGVVIEVFLSPLIYNSVSL
ncbi:stage II sporulation protein M [Pedobacter jamesrossensis]|uniref:Stage II sporulation protein M n=1 Tax=Pedobacter jamesrossensis TaxID=1908238 RepID=A0ABV8NL39_9SPHI